MQHSVVDEDIDGRSNYAVGNAAEAGGVAFECESSVQCQSSPQGVEKDQVLVDLDVPEFHEMVDLDVLEFHEVKRLDSLPTGKFLDSTELQDCAKRLGVGGAVPMREDENIDWETDLKLIGSVPMRSRQNMSLQDRVQLLEAELQNMTVSTKNAIKMELKAELLIEIPRLGNNCLSFDASLDQSCFGEKSAVYTNATSDVASQPGIPRGSTLDRVVEECAFQNSVWDLALFIGLPELGLLGSIWSTMLLFANVFVQVALTLIINEVFTAQPIDEGTVTAMRHWRVFFGHSFELADKLTFESLVSRVCRGDASIPYSEGVARLLVEISEYMPSPEDYDSKVLPFGHLVPHFETVGMVLCTLAILMWLLEIVAQCNKQLQLAIALKNLPTCKRVGDETGECLSLEGQSSVILTSMTAERKAWSYVLIILQFLVILPLAAMGACFMIATTDARELLLSCSALAIVHNTDEAFYAALAPRSGKTLMRSLKPLRRGVSATAQSLNWEAVFFFVCILSSIAYALVPLHDLLQLLRVTRDEVCGGNRNFLIVHDKAGIINAADAGLRMDDDTLEHTYSFEATRQLIVDGASVGKLFAAPGSMSGHSPTMTSSLWSLQAQSERNVVDVMEWWNVECRDMLPPLDHRYSPYFLRILRDTTLNSSINTCKDVYASCSGDNADGTRARQMCPVTCGCTNRSSGLVLEGIIGCPPACARSANYHASMTKPCVDEGISSAYWNRFISGLRSLQASYPSNWVGDFDASINMLQNHGCNVIQANLTLSFVHAMWENPCVTGPTNVKSLIYACPISCGCRTDYRSGCPIKCRAPAIGI